MLGGVFKRLALTRGKLAAKLAGVNGFTGRGSIACMTSAEGVDRLTVDLSGLAGRNADVFINNARSGTIAIKNGRAKARLVSRAGGLRTNDGARVEVRQNGDVVLAGVLTRA
ncbi:MAG: hypothetical protein AAFW68_03825 [Pseudomonadota bacterium]